MIKGYKGGSKEMGERVKRRPIKGKLLGVVLAIFVISGIIGAITGQLYAAEYLGKITTTGGEMATPGSLATGPDGRLYVADGSNNHVLIFDRAWRYIGDIPYNGVSAVAVAPDGTLYIGRNRDASVGVYRNGSISGYIGAGEIESVRDIAVDDATGDIYVVDSRAHLIRIYDSSGNSKGAIGGLYLPVAVAVAGDEVFVLDLPEVDDPSNPGTKTTGVRVSVFDRAGNLLRSFEDWLGNGGHLFRPQDIEVDSSGNIYIPDGYFLSVVQYDSGGNYLGEIKSTTDQMLIPRSVALSPDETRLYVSSNTTKSILVFSLDGTVGMMVNPLSMDFTAQAGTSPATQSLSITNTGTGIMNYLIDVSDSWITVDKTGGTVQGGVSDTVMVGVDLAGLTVGTYNGTITVGNDAGAVERVSITLEIKAPPKLVITPLSLTFEYTIGSATLPPEQPLTIGIENDPAGTYTWAVKSKDSWITISPTTGSGDTITQALVGVDPTGLVAGTYTGQINIDAPGVEGSPATVTVTLHVYSVGSIHVTTNLSEATFTIEGPGGVTYTGSGTDWSTNNVADGTYTITYGPVQGYLTPQPETKTLSGGGILEFNGVYEKANTTVMVISKQGKRADSTIRIVDTTGATLGEFQVLGNPGGGVDTAVADVDGDGAGEIIAGQLRGGATVGLYEADGTEIARFMATMDDKGIRVSGGDIDGDGWAEIITLIDEEKLKVFKYDGSGIIDTGMGINNIGIKAMDTADIDGDGVSELITLGEGSDKHSVSITVWSVQAGELMKAREFEIALREAKDVAVEDINGDMADDILISTKSEVYIFSLTGDLTGMIKTGKGITGLGAGDIDGDGMAEIMVGRKGEVDVYSGAGTRLMIIEVFDRKTGVRVSTGDLGI